MRLLCARPRVNNEPIRREKNGGCGFKREEVCLVNSNSSCENLICQTELLYARSLARSFVRSFAPSTYTYSLLHTHELPAAYKAAEKRQQRWRPHFSTRCGAHSFCADALRFQYAKTSLHPISISQPPFVDTSCATQKKKREWHWQIDSISRAILSFLLLLSLSRFLSLPRAPRARTIFRPLAFDAAFSLSPFLSDLRKHQTRLFRQWIQMCVYLFTRRKVYLKMHAASGKCMKNTRKAPFSMNKPIELLTRLSIGVGIFLILSCVNSRRKMCIGLNRMQTHKEFREKYDRLNFDESEIYQ
jgi:hypothetical protein